MKNPAPRLISLCLALFIQAGFVVILIWSRPVLVRTAPTPAELMMVLPPLAPTAPKPAARASRSTTPPAAVMKIPAPRSISPQAPPPSAIQSFGQALNGCAPESYDKLPPEQRAACANRAQGMASLGPREPDLMGKPSRVKNEAIWQAELARAHSPALMPCMGGLDVMCVLMKMADGSLSDFGDPKTWPIYQTKQLPPEDFHKIEQAYAEWHKDHPGTAR